LPTLILIFHLFWGKLGWVFFRLYAILVSQLTVSKNRRENRAKLVNKKIIRKISITTLNTITTFSVSGGTFSVQQPNSNGPSLKMIQT